MPWVRSVVPLATFARDDHVLLFIQLLEEFCRTRECDCGRGRESLEVEQLGGRRAGWARGPAAAAAQVAAGQEWREWERRGRETRVQLNQADEPRTSKNDKKKFISSIKWCCFDSSAVPSSSKHSHILEIIIVSTNNILNTNIQKKQEP